MRVEDFLSHSARRYPDKTAVVAGPVRMSYRELDAAANAVANALLDAGVSRGDRVVLFLDNCWEAIASIFGTLKAGAVFSVINASTKADKLSYVLNNCRASAMITQARLVKTAMTAAAQAPSVTTMMVAGAGSRDIPEGAIRFEDVLDWDDEPAGFGGIDLDLAMLVYTSGSTGQPKGVMMTHQNVDAAATSITTYLQMSEDDIVMNVLPISFDYGLYQVLMSAKAGATLILEKSFAFPQAIIEKMKAERVTGFPLVPTMAALLLQLRDLKPGDLPHLRYVTNTAAALPPAHILRLRNLFPQAKLFSMYGLTECKRCTWLPPSELERRPTSVGIAIPGTEAFIVDENGLPVMPGDVGELVIRGAHVMKGYWENPEATARALRPGPFAWEKVLYTGDLFRADEDGFLYFVGRKDDIIKCRGEKVSPKEVENAIYLLDEVREAAVIGVPDPVLGTAIKAVVVLAPGATLSERDVIRHCANALEDFMVPKFVEFRDQLPKTDTGKISRRLVANPELEPAE